MTTSGTARRGRVLRLPGLGPVAGPVTAAYSVRIELDRDEVGRGELRGRIKLGMAGLAEIITGHECLLQLLVTRIRRTISLG